MKQFYAIGASKFMYKSKGFAYCVSLLLPMSIYLVGIVRETGHQQRVYMPHGSLFFDILALSLARSLTQSLSPAHQPGPTHHLPARPCVHPFTHPRILIHSPTYELSHAPTPFNII